MELDSGCVRDRLAKPQFGFIKLKAKDLASLRMGFDGRLVPSQCETVSLLAMLSGHLKFRLGRSEFSRDNRIRESAGLVAAVAEWLIGGLPATAKADSGPAGKPERLAIRIDDLEIAFDAK